MTNYPTKWPQERIDRLIQLHAEGYNSTQIAGILTVPDWMPSRSAICGQISRLRAVGLVPPPKTRKNVRVGKAIESAVNSARLKASLTRVRIVPIVPVALPPKPIERKKVIKRVPAGCIPFEALTAHSCRWPIGDPSSPDFGYCGATKEIGQSYCDEHRKVAYTCVSSK